VKEPCTLIKETSILVYVTGTLPREPITVREIEPCTLVKETGTLVKEPYITGTLVKSPILPVFW